MRIDDKVGELMCATPMSKIPESARNYIKYLSSRYGCCGEVIVTGLYHYCQAVLNMKTKDALYKIDKDGEKWFKENKKKRSKGVKE
jgi:hypothetical protein